VWILLQREAESKPAPDAPDHVDGRTAAGERRREANDAAAQAMIEALPGAFLAPRPAPKDSTLLGRLTDHVNRGAHLVAGAEKDSLDPRVVDAFIVRLDAEIKDRAALRKALADYRGAATPEPAELVCERPKGCGYGTCKAQGRCLYAKPEPKRLLPVYSDEHRAEEERRRATEATICQREGGCCWRGIGGCADAGRCREPRRERKGDTAPPGTVVH
jgi:hypothetical protein